MKVKIFAATIILCLFASALPLWAAEQPIDTKSIIGNWKIGPADAEARFPMSGKLLVSKKADGSPDVQWTGGFGRDPKISAVKLDGKKLSFIHTALGREDNEMETNYEFTLQDNGKLTGKMTGERGELGLAGTRIWPKPEVVGTWEMKSKFGENEMVSKMIAWVNDMGKLQVKTIFERNGEKFSPKITDVKFEKGKLTYTSTMSFDENEFVATFEGELKGNEIAGKSVSDMGEIPVNGTRIGKEIIGEWDLVVDTDNGEMNSRLIVDKDLTAVYSMAFPGGGRGFEMDVNDLKLNGNNISFTIGMGQFKMDFKGKVSGDKLEGEMNSERGTDTVTGKRAAAKPATPAAPPAAQPKPVVKDPNAKPAVKDANSKPVEVKKTEPATK
jgi:hypothetical protein